MPLVRLSAEQAVSTRKSNDYSGWGDRTSENRVEPIALPAFKVPFKIAPGSKIFTVGSCFARNVEDELMRLGFELPIRQVPVDDRAVLNNYGTPSIYNEFSWAFGEQLYDPDENIVEIMPGKFADLHLAPYRRLQTYEQVLANRMAIQAAYRRAAECPVMIMTLGLLELWFDCKTGYYLNVGPRPSQISAEPARFEMHVLSFQECYDYLERTIQLLLKHCRPDLRILLTVSPVPLTKTHRDEDVIVANCYSKSALRAVAETVIAKHEFISYFPSYESVIYSDRKRAWLDDMIHVRKDFVAINVSRMVEAFICGDEDPGSWRALIDGAGPDVAIAKAKAIRTGPRKVAALFFKEFDTLSKEIPEFALEHAQHLMDTGDFEGALAVIDGAAQNAADAGATILKSQALIQLGRAAEAYSVLDAYVRPMLDKRHKIKSKRFWNILLKAAMATGTEAFVMEALYRVVSNNYKHEVWAYTLVGIWYLDQTRFDLAIQYLEMAINTGEEAIQANFFLAEAYAALGKRDQARAVLARLPSDDASQSAREQRLRSLLASVESL